MSRTDYASGLPVRSEADGLDEKVIVKVVDGTSGGSNQMTVDSDKNAHAEMHGNDPAGTDRVVRTSELGALTPDGVYHATDNTKPGNLATIVHQRVASPGDAQSTIRATGVQSSVNPTVWVQDVGIRDENGNPFSATNPLPTTSVDSGGDEINNFFESVAAIAVGSSDNHDYTVSVGKTLKLSQVWATASSKMIIDVQVETGVATGIFNTVFMGYNSTANPNILIPINESVSVATGVRVRITRTNKDNQLQTMYSTISGHEI